MFSYLQCGFEPPLHYRHYPGGCAVPWMMWWQLICVWGGTVSKTLTPPQSVIRDRIKTKDSSDYSKLTLRENLTSSQCSGQCIWTIQRLNVVQGGHNKERVKVSIDEDINSTKDGKLTKTREALSVRHHTKTSHSNRLHYVGVNFMGLLEVHKELQETTKEGSNMDTWRDEQQRNGWRHHWTWSQSG